ncbi:MAG: hypothetical protein JSU94_04420 [Phycisphaerales bacterium]|nr:MAG: hypothetical protein JSU94_04420 [Phycisphaerales bacterium]
MVEAKGKESAIDIRVKAFKSWAGQNPHTSFWVGIALLTPALILGLLNKLFNVRLPEILMLPALALCLLWFPAAYLIAKSLYVSLKTTGRSAALAPIAVATGLILAGGAVLLVFVSHAEALHKWLTGSLILYGPIPIPGVILFFLIPGLAVLLIGAGIIVFVETLRPKTKKPHIRR